MKTKKWIQWWFIIVLLILSFITLFNYVIDPYGFNQKIQIKGINAVKEDNTPFTIKYKMPHLREGGWNNLMLGTSRTGLMDTHIVDKYLGGKTFSMSLPGSAMPLQFDSFWYAIQFNHIKNLIYGIDFMTFNKNRKFNDDYIQYKDELQSFGLFSTFDIYVNLKTFQKSMETILNNISEEPIQHPFYSRSGMRNYPDFKQQLKNGSFNMQKSVNTHLQMYYKKNGIYANYVYAPEYMEMFKQVIDYCKKHDINIYVYIPPMYIEHFNALKEAGLQDEFEYFKRELVKVTEFIDFSGLNTITTDKTKFWDSSHLKKKYTELIMQKVLNNHNKQKHKDFGVNVAPYSIEEHLKRQSTQYKYIDLKEILDTIYKN